MTGDINGMTDDYASRVLAHRYGYDDESLARRARPSVSPLSDEQGLSCTDGPTEGSGPQIATQRAKPADRLVYDEDGLPDDLWLTNVDVHIERNSKRRWYVAVYGDDGRRILAYMRDVNIADAEGLDDCTTTAKAAARAYRLAADMIEEEA